MIYELARRIFAAFGLIPAHEAAEGAELALELRALGVTEGQRPDVIRAASIIAQSGFTPEEVAEALMAYVQLPFNVPAFRASGEVE